MIFTTRLPVLFHDTLMTCASKCDNQNIVARLQSVTALEECEVATADVRYGVCVCLCVIKLFVAG